MCTGICRVRGSRFSRSSTPRPGMIGQVDVQQNGARQKLRRCNEAIGGRRRGDALKAHLAHQIAQYHREGRIVFDHQDDSAARRDRMAIIFRD